ncbi:hypothetical protein Ae201684P_012563 [Aphanomyces euteiches]|nr:hypothetical protein Ae201684P_012563 [Aphanomyces euteiches]
MTTQATISAAVAFLPMVVCPSRKIASSRYSRQQGMLQVHCRSDTVDRTTDLTFSDDMVDTTGWIPTRQAEQNDVDRESSSMNPSERRPIAWSADTYRGH